MLTAFSHWVLALVQPGLPGRLSAHMVAASRRATLPISQINSDSRATAEYFDYLLGRNQQETTTDCPSIVVGGGRIGSMLLDFGSRRGFDDILIKRGDPIPADHPGPIYICTQTADLEAVIAQCPVEKKDDLVFLQDGQLEPLFARYGLYGPTQASLWLAQMRVGGKPVDGTTAEAPEGLTTVHGKWAGSLAMRLGTGNMACHERMQRDARRSMLEKLVFVSAYNLVGSVYGGITVGEVASKHGEEVGYICRELASFIRYTLAVSLFSGLDERLAAYATHMEFLPTKLTDFEFRNGYFYKYSKMAGVRVNPAGIKVDVPDTTPTHTEYLRLARENEVISQGLLDSV
mmetsp:Transcript_27277/g.45462  ORF Transcript_27277/g.45462 Transcript_27277/m.45462 type:complete len:346 (-) Transcript_27277:144-1181(-)|eukprot:CAMPEP_0119303850 /NCGR_PEP_ID=MMETSP1333-20130426/5220_1 /TAXON_ID=418940 /ORGANISM="Scyphosphaera apsteinii, Strain RCC1455" /LENGTH=345 /DNA_ID=CAMNT_0007306621 /DNA_START=49 /DNA_END=1086 /DNA_ORIENTATION=-